MLLGSSLQTHHPPFCHCIGSCGPLSEASNAALANCRSPWVPATAGSSAHACAWPFWSPLVSPPWGSTPGTSYQVNQPPPFISPFPSLLPTISVVFQSPPYSGTKLPGLQKSCCFLWFLAGYITISSLGHLSVK